MYKHILIASDGSELAQKALEHGLDLAKSMNAKVLIVTISEPIWNAVPGEMAISFPYEQYEAATKATAERILAAASHAAQKYGVPYTSKHVKDQFPAEGIVAAAKENGCDLIVMASHGRRGLAKLVLGSQAGAVMVSSPVPVLVYREAGTS